MTSGRHLFAGIPVSDYPRAITWFEQLLGVPATFEAHDTESVWDLATGQAIYVVLRPEIAGGGLVTTLYDDGDDLVGFLDGAAQRGLRPDLDETYGNGVRKVTFRDPDGNEVGFGAMPSNADE